MPSDTDLGPGDESLLCSGLVGIFALPGCKSRGLQCTAVREGQLPGAMEGHLVDGVQVDGGLLLTLASGQEADAWKDERKRLSTCTWKLLRNLKSLSKRKRWLLWCSPGTDAGTVRLKAVTVAMATSWGVNFLGQECPGVTMLGFNSVPSR